MVQKTTKKKGRTLGKKESCGGSEKGEGPWRTERPAGDRGAVGKGDGIDHNAEGEEEEHVSRALTIIAEVVERLGSQKRTAAPPGQEMTGHDTLQR